MFIITHFLLSFISQKQIAYALKKLVFNRVFQKNSELQLLKPIISLKGSVR